MHLVLWPAAITLAITLLRLVGELQGWSPALFNAAAGGGGALIGISWLPLVLGPYFAWTLARGGKGPDSAWRVAGMAVLGMAVAFATFAGLVALKLGIAAVVGGSLVSLATAFMPWKAWPELGKVLFAYALSARVPVTIVMLVAIFGQWGTHYDVLPPNPPPSLLAMGPLGKWLAIGFLPQMTFWVAFTVLVGTLIGALVVAVARPRPAVP